MDIARPDIKQKKKRQMFVWAGVAVVVLLGAVVAVSRLKPAAPPVDRSTIWTDTVKRGPMIRQVRGSTGTLVPREDSIQLIPAQTDATVVHIRVLPGTKVTPDTILLDMSDPELEQKLLNARLAEQQAEADYKSLQAQLQSTLMDKKITAAQVNADYTTDDPAEAAEGADLVVIATPLSAYPQIGERISPVLMEGAILTDVGSVKQVVIRDLQPHLSVAILSEFHQHRPYLCGHVQEWFAEPDRVPANTGVFVCETGQNVCRLQFAEVAQ